MYNVRGPPARNLQRAVISTAANPKAGHLSRGGNVVFAINAAYPTKLPAGRRAAGAKRIAVRFVNVLGSAGSASELFLRQARADVPLTVTDTGMIRYWITMAHAATLAAAIPPDPLFYVEADISGEGVLQAAGLESREPSEGRASRLF